MNSLKGVIAAAATPLDENLAIDLDRLVDHCRHLLEDGGCDAINLLGTTGEATSFSLARRLAAMRAVAISGLPLPRFMVGTGAAALEDACSLTAESRELGFAGALLLPPFYYKGIGDDALVGYVRALVERVGGSGLNLYLYNFPTNSGVPYSVDVVTRLKRAFPDTIKGLKDSSGDLDYSAELAKSLPGFDVFPSDESVMARTSDLGLAGCISATANVTGPLVQRAIAGNFSGPDLADAAKIRSEVAKFPLVASVKETLALVTGELGWRRMAPPLTPLCPDQTAQLKSALEGTALSTRLKP